MFRPIHLRLASFKVHAYFRCFSLQRRTQRERPCCQNAGRSLARCVQRPDGMIGINKKQGRISHRRLYRSNESRSLRSKASGISQYHGRDGNAIRLASKYYSFKIRQVSHIGLDQAYEITLARPKSAIFNMAKSRVSRMFAGYSSPFLLVCIPRH